ncbi:MAG: hypothetical protein RLZ10_2085, partial [Bacteroidota bacterium]
MAIPVSKRAEPEKLISNSPKAYSATPLAPGVGLININNHSTNCFPN